MVGGTIPNSLRQLVTQDSAEDYHRLMGSLTVARVQSYHFICGGRVSIVRLVRILAIVIFEGLVGENLMKKLFVELKVG